MGFVTKLWRKLPNDDMVKGMVIILLALFNLFFWLNSFDAPPSHQGFNWACDGNSTLPSTSCQFVSFDNHGVGLSTGIILSVILLEIIFFILILKRQKPEWESWSYYAFKLKSLAMGYVLLFYITIVPIFGGIISLTGLAFKNVDKIKEFLFGLLIVIGIIGAIVLWYLLNTLLAKSVSQVKKRAFKVGDKVKVKSYLEKGETYGGNYFNWGMTDFRGKKVTIKSLEGHKIFIKEDKGEYSWRDEMFEEPRRAKDGR